jgi:predicted ATPase
VVSIIGRDHEVADVGRLLQRARLVTLTGAGGSGKTRLAMEVARREQSSFANGVCFVSLAPLAQADQVAQAIAQALGITSVSDLSIIELLQRFLRDKSLLLVIDNYEHVLDAAPLATQLLSAAPALKVLVTSRELLRLSGEHAYPVEPLANDDAVHLFVMRAQAAWPGFVMNDMNRADVMAVCRQLDGLPLAIELAAARVRQFTLQQLVERLTPQAGAMGGGLSVLSHGPRDLPARQQTLRDTIEWSYRLLSEDEQRLFRALAVFAGGAALPQIAQVHAALRGEQRTSTQVEDLLGSLAAKHLVTITANAGVETRYSMLELIREYAWQRLIDQDEDQQARRCHADAYAALCEQGKPHILGMPGGRQREWMDRLQREWENIRAVMGWCLGPEGDLRPAIRLMAGMNWFLRSQTVLWDKEGYAWLRHLSRHAPADAPADQMSWVHMLCGFPPTHGEESIALSGRSLQLAYESEEEDCIANSIISLGIDLNHDYSDGHGTPMIEQGLALARRLGSSFLIGYGLHYLAQARVDYEGKLDEAMQLYEERNALVEATGHDMLFEPTLLMAGLCELQRLNFDRALHLAARARYRQNVFGWDAMETHRIEAEAALGTGNVASARASAQEGFEYVALVSNKPTVAFWLALKAKVAVAAGALDEARGCLAQSIVAYQSSPPDVGGLIDVLENLFVIPVNVLEVAACVAGAEGDATRAARLFGAAQAMRKQHRVPRLLYMEHWLAPFVAAVRAALGDAAYAFAFAEGESMTLDEALALVMKT